MTFLDSGCVSEANQQFRHFPLQEVTQTLEVIILEEELEGL